MEFLISPEDLKRRLDTGSVRFIFDLRNGDEFASWRIEGRSDVETVNIPQIAFVGEEARYLDRLPKDRQIVIICAHGDSSRYSAQLLRQHGFDAVSLQGGMDAWGQFYETHQVSKTPAIYQIYRVARGCITHVIVSDGEAVVIDPVRHIDRVIDMAHMLKAKIAHVFDTHLQADHISGGLEIAQRTGVTYHMSFDDAASAVFPYVPLKDGELIGFGKSRIEVICSAGHTPGSTSFLLDRKFLFAGDTIMKTSIGRPDLGGKVEEWSRLLYDTLFRKYEKLDDSIIVLPTHAASIREQDAAGAVRTTLGEARQGSDLYEKMDFTEFLNSIKSSLTESPERYQEIRKVNLGILAPDEKKRQELEIGKNLCGMGRKS